MGVYTETYTALKRYSIKRIWFIFKCYLDAVFILWRKCQEWNKIDEKLFVVWNKSFIFYFSNVPTICLHQSLILSLKNFDSKYVHLFTFHNQHFGCKITKLQQISEVFVWYTHVTVAFCTVECDWPFIPLRLISWTQFGRIHWKLIAI